MHSNVMVSKKAWDTWNQICCAWFDYDSASYVTSKAYYLHVEIDYILMYGDIPKNWVQKHSAQ